MKRPTSLFFAATLMLLVACSTVYAREYHVSTSGNDAGRGSKSAPFRTIQRAADVAQPGDVVTVHAGVYRERITPPRGGISDRKRIVYRAARGEKVEIKGSEVIKGWVKVQENVWKVTLPDSFFGGFNPYTDLVKGDWFVAKGREHHTGAVYLNGEWLTEATKLEEVLMPPGKSPTWLAGAGSSFLMNLAWLRPVRESAPSANIQAPGYLTQQGVQNAPCSEGGECVGFIEHGDWVKYQEVDFGQGTQQIDFRAASDTDGGIIEIRLDSPEGELLGSCPVANTGGWQSWETFKASVKPISGVKPLCLVFKAPKPSEVNPHLWFAQVGNDTTTIWAQFEGVDPNEQLTEINVRQTVFYPDKPGRNYITVRGFTMRHAATPWAPPTAEQIGLIGTHWSKGWIIEDNLISHSICSGIALGKHGDQWDNTSANTAEGYVKTIERGHQNGWTRENIGHHVVRNNTISHCEQAGIVGSLGAAFSTVTGNIIHDIHVRRLFTGAEMAGIKFHAAIDSVIRGNHIYRTCRGLWLDWMAQGTRVSCNLFHENTSEDLFMEVDHGPFLVDNNLFLSKVSLLDMSEGGAYAHNLFCGRIISRPELSRETPYHPAHSTEVAGLVNIKGGDNRFYNNVFVGRGQSSATKAGSAAKDPESRGGFGLWMYDYREFPVKAAGNLFYNGAKPYAKERGAIVVQDLDPDIELVEQGGHCDLRLNLGPEVMQAGTALVTTASLGSAKIPGLPYEDPDGSPLKVNTDYFGKKRHRVNPTPGPFERPGTGQLLLKVQ